MRRAASRAARRIRRPTCPFPTGSRTIPSCSIWMP